jgi:class 3 adenylate cyclase/DNA-binding SARP family transcriptional activator
VEFLVLGPLEVSDGERLVPLRSAKLRHLLTALLLHCNEVVAVARLVDILWGNEPPADAPKTLTTHVSRLRALLDPDRATNDPAQVLLTRPPGYLLRVEPNQIDAIRFDRLVADAQRRAADEPAAAHTILDEALALWRGRAYAEFADEDFACSEAIRLDELRKLAIDERVEAKLNLGECERAAAELERLVVDDPFREHRWELLMVALQRCGRQADALLAYERVRALLADKLDIDPGPSLVALEAAILRQEAITPGLPARSGAVRSAATPLSEAPAHPKARELPTGTVTFFFTDIEGSTQLWENQPEAMRQALARHDTILRDAIEAHRGHIVKTTGDGVFAVFAAAPDAVAGAADALRALSSEAWGDATGPLRIRIGIHTGKAEERDGDYFGPALNLASRVMGAAHGGQVVLSKASANVVRQTLPDALTLVDLGEHRLRGLALPQRVYQLTIAGFRSEFPPLQSLDALPGRLPVPASFGDGDEEIAGRSIELDCLERAWARARDGVRQVALIAGEPGIGKTRLAAELSNRVSAQGGLVFYGRCDEETIVPYQPFVEALRPCVAAYSLSALHERLHGLEQDLSRVFPELLGRLPDVSDPIPSDPESERYRLFEAITGLVTGVTATQSAVLVLDDLHWADKPTLLLLRHIVRSVQDAALLIVVCYREMELARDHPLADLVADFRREPFVAWIGLDGLSEAESRTLLEGQAGVEIASSLSAVLHDETGGNPLFLEELLRHLIETDRVPLGEADGAHSIDFAALDLPAGVRDVVARRVRRLPEPVNDVLGLAAVIGVEFDAALIGQAAQRPTGDVLESLDQATDARLVRERPGRMGQYAFSHALIRQTVYQELRTARRARLHARVGSAMEEADGSELPVAALAHHFTQAVPLGTALKAIEYTTKAGHEAVADLAFEDAVAHFERALDLLEQHVPGDRAQRVELLTDLADALVEVDEGAGVEAALRAVETARETGSPEQFGRAVAVFSERKHVGSQYLKADFATLYDETRAVLGDSDPGLRARLLALEAFDYATDVLQGRSARALAEEALDLARSAGDPEALALALFSLASSLEGTPEVAERAAIGEELVNLGQSAGGRTATAKAFGLRILAGARLEMGDADALTSTIAELARIGEELHWLPAHAYAALWRATQAVIEGRFDDVHKFGNEMRQYTRAYRAVAAMHIVQLFYLAREQGNLDKFIPAVERFAEEREDNFYVRAMLALAQLDAGEDNAALLNLDGLAAHDFGRDQRGSAWAAVLGFTAEIAASGGTRTQSSVLYDLLTPFRGRLLVASLGLGCLGAADRYLGMLSTVLERWDEAESHFEQALALEERVRGRALLPRTRYWKARFLFARGRPDDDEAARVLLRTVIDETSRLGMRGLLAQTEELATVRTAGPLSVARHAGRS